MHKRIRAYRYRMALDGRRIFTVEAAYPWTENNGAQQRDRTTAEVNNARACEILNERSKFKERAQAKHTMYVVVMTPSLIPFSIQPCDDHPQWVSTG